MAVKNPVFVFTGKGGVGKTSLSAAFVRLLSQRYPDKKILAVDADPAVGLATALGIEPSLTVDSIRKKIAESIESGKTRDAVEMLSEARFHMFDAICERDNISFLSIGRPEGAGCYCKVNAYLKQVLETVSGGFDYVVIDGEAGIEQINRRVTDNITHLILVSDGSKKGIAVINTIKKVADTLVSFEGSGVILNRVTEDFRADAALLPAPLLAVIHADEKQLHNDIDGKTVFELDSSSKLLTGAALALDTLLGE